MNELINSPRRFGAVCRAHQIRISTSRWFQFFLRGGQRRREGELQVSTKDIIVNISSRAKRLMRRSFIFSRGGNFPSRLCFPSGEPSRLPAREINSRESLTS